MGDSKRRLWNDLATVFLEGVSYRHIEKVLYERFGHIDERTGKRLNRYFAYHTLHNPIFWGNAGYNYKSAGSKNGQKVGAWVYDPSCQAPEGVHIFYGVNTPVYTGELASKVKDELRRRAMVIQGTARPYRTHMFTGLILCGYCQHYMVYGSKNVYRCQSHSTARYEPKCDRFRHISETKVQAWVHARLTDMLEYDMPDLLARSDDREDGSGRIETLKVELDGLRAQARALVLKQAQAHSALTSIYDEQLQVIGERIKILERELAEDERAQRARDTSTATTAFKTLPLDVGDIWKWDSTTVNQLLHRLMGSRRMVVIDCEIVGMADAPAPSPKETAGTHLFRQEPNRTYRVMPCSVHSNLFR